VVAAPAAVVAAIAVVAEAAAVVAAIAVVAEAAAVVAAAVVAAGAAVLVAVLSPQAAITSDTSNNRVTPPARRYERDLEGNFIESSFELFSC
jgi:hypothetical protein